MLTEIIDSVVNALRGNGADEVYSAFDAKPVEKKNHGIFTTVGISAFESTTPIYTYNMIYLPFKAEIEINVTAPAQFSAEELYSFYDSSIQPAVHELEGLSCSLKKLTLRFDSNVQRLVLCVKLSAGGMTKIERSR